MKNSREEYLYNLRNNWLRVKALKQFIKKGCSLKESKIARVDLGLLG